MLPLPQISCAKAILTCSLAFLTIQLYGQYTIGGNASSLGGGCYQITPATANQSGYVYTTGTINLTDTITLKFQVNLGANNANGADGMVFVLRDSIQSALIGTGGGSLGFEGTVNPPGGSIGIEIDTWQNAAVGDPVADHIGMQKNWTTSHTGANAMAGPVQALVANINVEDGNFHTFHIKWNPTTQVLKVFLDCTERLTYTGDIVNQIFSGNNEVHWGFVGSTGASTNNQRFCLGTPIESLVTPLSQTYDICKGDAVTLNAGNAAVSYLWSPAVGLSSPTSQSPIASPQDTTLYVVEQSYQCDTIYDSALVQVIPPNFSITAAVTNAACKSDCNGDIDVSVVGGTSAYSYLWSNASSTQDVSSLCTGSYTVTIQDVSVGSPSYLCYVVDTYTVTEPLLLEADIINATKTSCPGIITCDAQAQGTALGGTTPYGYHWNTGEYTQTGALLCKGWNVLTVTDAHGCVSVDSVKISVPDSIVTEAFSDTLICISNVAAIAATSKGGTPPFTYVWTENSLNGPIMSLNSNDAVTPSVTTQYFVSSTDSRGCPGDTAEVLVSVRPPLGVELSAPDTICPYDTVSIFAVGVGGDSLYTFSWETGDFGSSTKVSPDLTRLYRITVSDFCGTPNAFDSIRIQVGGYGAITPHINLEDDSVCRNENAVYMIASAVGGHNGPDEYVITWQHNENHQKVQFVDPEITTTYVVKVEDLCLSPAGFDTVTIHVGDTVSPALSFFPSMVCQEADVNVMVENHDSAFTYHLDFVGENFSANFDPQNSLFRFDEVGCYDFTLNVTTDFGCVSSKYFECGVKVNPKPKSAFDFTPDYPSNVNPFVDFKELSTGHDHSFWVINKDTFKNESTLRYEFYERPQPFNVYLVAVTNEGCIDSASKQLSYVQEALIFVPNSFTPNGDGVNDYFLIGGEGVELDGFELSIFDRWGEQVFRTTRQSQGWDGKTPNGRLVPTGAYFLQLKYRDHQGSDKLITSEVFIGATGDKRDLY